MQIEIQVEPEKRRYYSQYLAQQSALWLVSENSSFCINQKIVNKHKYVVSNHSRRIFKSKWFFVSKWISTTL